MSSTRDDTIEIEMPNPLPDIFGQVTNFDTRMLNIGSEMMEAQLRERPYLPSTQHTHEVGDIVIGKLNTPTYKTILPNIQGTVLATLPNYQIEIQRIDSARKYTVPGSHFNTVHKAKDAQTKKVSRNTSRLVSLGSTLWVQEQYKKDMMKLRGESVLLKRDESNSYIGQIYKGIIVDIQPHTEDPLTIEKTIFVLHVDGISEVYKAKYFQFEIDRNINVPVKAIYKYVADAINTGRPQEIKNAEYKIRDARSAKQDYEKRAKEYADKLEEQEKILATLQKNDKTYTEKSLAEQFAMIKKHAHIEKAYISVDGNIIVITKMLEALDGNTLKPLDRRFGRMIIRLHYDKNGGSYSIKASNMDFASASGREHPNISTDDNTICWGNNGTEVLSMLQTGSIYLLVDFMITFFSLFPHPSGSPYTNPIEWLNNLQPNTNIKFLEEEI